MKRIFIFVLLVSAATIVRAQDIAGDWQGTLNTGMGELRLVLHITKAADGSLTASLDSVDQGANGILVKSAKLKDSKLSLDVAAVQGTYEGTVAVDGKTIAGTWDQGKTLALEFKKATTPIKTEHKPAKPSDIDGTWMGTLDTGTGKLRVVFHILNTEDGLIATMDSPDQGAQGIPTSSVARNGATLKIEAKGISGVFEGTISGDLSSIDGRWTQGGGTMPLVLKRVKAQAEVELKMPQIPVRPYPYMEVERARHGFRRGQFPGLPFGRKNPLLAKAARSGAPVESLASLRVASCYRLPPPPAETLTIFAGDAWAIISRSRLLSGRS